MKKASLVLIDNHEIFRANCRQILEVEDDIEIIGEFGTLGEAFYFIKKRFPDIVIMDTLFKYTTSLELIQLFKEYSPETRFIILTIYLDEQHIRELVKAGISAYIAKDDMEESLVSAIFSALEGKIYLSPTVQKNYSNPSDFSPTT